VAAKTWADLITESRETLQDTDTPYRYTDTVLLNFLNQGLQVIGTSRPDAFWDRWLDEDILIPRVVAVDPDLDTDPLVLSSPDDDEVATTDIFTDVLPIIFYVPLVFYVIGRAELIEDEFTSDGRAMAVIKAFATAIRG